MISKGQIAWTRFLNHILQSKQFAIVEACVIGLVAALAAVFLKTGVAWLSDKRILSTMAIPAPLLFPAVGAIGGLVVGILVALSPETTGSGIPQVKAVLAKVPIPLDLRVAVMKLLGGVITLGSGMTLGREGPTVQVGAAIAAQISRWVPTSPNYRRQLIAAGAGAGLAAAFNAPIAGVLFVVEELLQDVSSLTLGTAILASFVGAVVSRWLGGHNLELNPTNYQTSFSPQDIPFLIALGVLSGILGALFNRGILVSLSINRSLRLKLPLRVAFAGLICGALLVMLPFPLQSTEGLRNFLVNAHPSWQVALVAFIAQFFLTVIAYGSGAPGGLFAPALALGAALGYLVGVFEQSVFGMGLPTTYALAGMGAFFTAVARVPITGIVIVFEMTTDFNLVLPLMIGSAIAYLVADKIAPGSLYDHLLEWSGIHLNESKPHELWATLTAGQVMQPKVETLASRTLLNEAVQAFSHSSHRSFPVIEAGRLVGMVSQKDLANISQQRFAANTTVAEIMTPDPVTARPTDTLVQVLHLLNRYQLSALPVADNRRLVGIITRSDMIRVEADYWSGRLESFGPKPNPSYVVYQVRAPATGQGRLLVPLCNPKTAATLLQIAAAIAQERHYEIECLHVIPIARDHLPSETPVETTAAQQLLQQAIQMGQFRQIPVHVQIRVAHDVAGAMLETIKERHIDLMLMGWEGSTGTPNRIFSQSVDTVIRQASCEVILAKLPDTMRFDRWLVAVGGGPNTEEAIHLLPALTSLSTMPEVKLCQVFQPIEHQPDISTLKQAAHFLEPRLHGSIDIVPLSADSISKAVLDYARTERSDVIILGASREGLLQQVMYGNIPATIAHNSSCAVLLVRNIAA